MSFNHAKKQLKNAHASRMWCFLSKLMAKFDIKITHNILIVCRLKYKWGISLGVKCNLS